MSLRPAIIYDSQFVVQSIADRAAEAEGEVADVAQAWVGDRHDGQREGGALDVPPVAAAGDDYRLVAGLPAVALGGGQGGREGLVGEVGRARPLLDVADHVEDAVGAGVVRVAADRQRLGLVADADVGPLGVHGAAPGEGAAGAWVGLAVEGGAAAER